MSNLKETVGLAISRNGMIKQRLFKPAGFSLAGSRQEQRVNRRLTDRAHAVCDLLVVTARIGKLSLISTKRRLFSLRNRSWDGATWGHSWFRTGRSRHRSSPSLAVAVFLPGEKQGAGRAGGFFLRHFGDNLSVIQL